MISHRDWEPRLLLDPPSSTFTHFDSLHLQHAANCSLQTCANMFGLITSRISVLFHTALSKPTGKAATPLMRMKPPESRTAARSDVDSIIANQTVFNERCSRKGACLLLHYVRSTRDLTELNKTGDRVSSWLSSIPSLCLPIVAASICIDVHSSLL